MKHFSKQLSWLLAFVLIFTSIVSTGIPVYAADDTITIGEGTNAVFANGTRVRLDGDKCISIRYYESKDSDTAVYEYKSSWSGYIGDDDMAIQPYAWHIEHIETKNDDISSSERVVRSYFKAYPVTSLEDTPVNEEMTFPEGTTLTTSGSAIDVSVSVGTTELKNYSASSPFTLPSASEISSLVGESALTGYNLPDLTKLYYIVELTNKSTTPYSLKLTLVPTVEVTFDENTGTVDSGKEKMYAIPKAIINTSKFPTASKADFGFYQWRIDSYIDENNPTVSRTSNFKAIYQEKIPTFQLDFDLKKVTGLLPNRTYAYTPWDNIVADANGEIVNYDQIKYFVSYSRLRLKSTDTAAVVDSDFVSLKHEIPTMVVKYTLTTAWVTNRDEFKGMEFKIIGGTFTSDWADFSEFPESLTELTTGTDYAISVKHKADTYGFENTKQFPFRPSKLVSTEDPKGVEIADIPDQPYTDSAILPSVKVTDGDTTLVKGTDYRVDYAYNWRVGTATATVTFLGIYSGRMEKDFNIKPSKAVSFDKNDGTGTMPDVYVIDGHQYTLPACTFTAPANKAFKAWDISGTEYAPGANYAITDNITVTAVWKDIDKDLEKVETPVISPNGGTFSGSQTVTITSETSDAIIYYTTNGTEPTIGSTVYSGPFTLSNSATVKSIAVKEGMADSDIASASFTKSTSNSGGSSGGTTTPTVTVKSKEEPKPADNSKNELVLTIGKKDAKVFGSDKTTDVAPIIRNGRTMLPARFVAESLGAVVTWNGKKQEVTIKGKNEKGEDVTILIYINSNIAFVNGNEVKLDSPAFIESGRTCTPIRFIAEILGATVDWVGEQQKVVITKKINN